MNAEIIELQRKYIAGRLEIADARKFLEYLYVDESAPFRADRITKLERFVSDYERRRATEAERLYAEEEAAKESVMLTEKWESLGATWRGIGSVYTVWEYGGHEFYRWESGVSVIDEIVRKRAADGKLSDIITEGASV